MKGSTYKGVEGGAIAREKIHVSAFTSNPRVYSRFGVAELQQIRKYFSAQILLKCVKSMNSTNKGYVPMTKWFDL